MSHVYLVDVEARLKQFGSLRDLLKQDYEALKRISMNNKDAEKLASEILELLNI